MDKQQPTAMDVLNHPNWNQIWTTLNWYASGDCLSNHSGTDPNAVLGEVYFMLAQIDSVRNKVLNQAKETP